MAKTIDTLQVDATVTGAEQIAALQAKLDSIEASSKKTATAMNQVQGGVRNVAYQIQDLAVQLSMGTNAFMALGQQLPQLLSGFGTVGVVIGAVAAVAIPLLQVGLKAAGVDMRNLSEMTKDLADSTTRFIEAQKQNQSTIVGMGNSYGVLTDEAKKFFELKQQILEIKTEDENSKAVKQLVKDYGFLTDARLKNAQAMAEQGKFLPPGGAMAAGAELAGLQMRVKMLGLTTDQAIILGEKLKGIDQSSPEKTVSTINDVLKYLKEIGPQTDNFRLKFEKTIDPMMKINEELIKQKSNIKESTEYASNFAASMMLIQTPRNADIASAKRNFDQIRAIREEGALKATEFELNLQKKENETGTTLNAERTAFHLKNQQEINDKIKDFSKGQSEAFNTQMLSNEAKLRELNTQSKINDLQLQQVDGINYTLMAEERTLKNVLDQQNAMSAIAEMRRKNAISASQAAMLEQQISETRKKADEIGEQAAKKIAVENERSIRIQIQGLQTTNAEKLKALGLDMNSLTMSTNRYNFEKKQLDVENARARGIIDINNNTRLSDDEKESARKRLNDEYNVGLEILKSEYDWAQKITDSFGAGAVDKIKGIQESFSNFKTAGMMVDSVWGNMSSSLDRFVETGKLSFSDLTRSIIIDLEKIALKSAVVGMFKSVGLMDFFALPGRASGGPVSAGDPYIVGEQGPELFIPQNAGRIVPNGATGGSGSFGGGTTIINNISAIDAKSVAQLFAENRMTLFGTVEQARRELPMRTR